MDVVYYFIIYIRNGSLPVYIEIPITFSIVVLKIHAKSEIHRENVVSDFTSDVEV